MEHHTHTIAPCTLSLMAALCLGSCSLLQPPQEEGPWRHIFAHMDDYTVDKYEGDPSVTPLNPGARPCVDSGLSSPGCN